MEFDGKVAIVTGATTGLGETIAEEVLSRFAVSHPMGRLAERKEVAHLVAFLLSDHSTFSTGGLYPVDGGYTAR